MAPSIPETLDVPPAELRRVVDTALAEDLGWGDVTTDNLVPSSTMARAAVVYRTAGIVCGIPVLTRVFQTIDPDVTVEALVPEGERVEKGATAPPVRARARARAVVRLRARESRR